MKKVLLVVAAALFAATLAAPAGAYFQPPMNLGLTDVLDGAVPGPGTYFTEYVQAYNAGSVDGVPGASVANVLSMNQLVHVYKHKVGGAHLGADLLLPLVAIGTEGPLNSNPAYMGDLTVGPFLQWFDTKLAGKPFFQRLELDISRPPGEYDRNYAINPGSNHWVIEPYYAFTWFLTPEFSTSWRVHYTYSTKNSDTDVRPGQALHANYSFEYEFRKNMRAAVAGYFLAQTTDDDLPGPGNPGREQAFAIGPAFHWIVDDHFSLGVKTAWETGVMNRPDGDRTTLRFTYQF
jgi:anthranilate 1,2-dioxygenase (deaminating, decarboxylating) large subunit